MSQKKEIELIVTDDASIALWFKGGICLGRTSKLKVQIEGKAYVICFDQRTDPNGFIELEGWDEDKMPIDGNFEAFLEDIIYRYIGDLPANGPSYSVMEEVGKKWTFSA